MNEVDPVSAISKMARVLAGDLTASATLVEQQDGNAHADTLAQVAARLVARFEGDIAERTRSLLEHW
jgi:hypothetical protein